MIKQADEHDIKAIEEILLDAVNWLNMNNLSNQWTKTNTKWATLSQNYKLQDFYIDYKNGLPAACIAITDQDTTYWPEIPKGQSLYIHKLVVKRAFAGGHLSRELIDFAKDLAIKKNINSIRLDCNLYRYKLRQLYEDEGFVYVSSKTIKANSPMALYVWSK